MPLSNTHLQSLAWLLEEGSPGHVAFCFNLVRGLVGEGRLLSTRSNEESGQEEGALLASLWGVYNSEIQ